MDDGPIIELEESEQDLVISTDTIVVTTYSTCARHVLELAEASAASAPGGALTCEHLLLAMIADPECAAAQVLDGCGFPADTIARTIAFIGGPQSPEDLSDSVILSPRVERVLATAQTEAGTRAAEQVDTLHLLFALIRERQGIAAAALEAPGVGHEIVGAALSNAFRTGMTDPS